MSSISRRNLIATAAGVAAARSVGAKVRFEKARHVSTACARGAVVDADLHLVAQQVQSLAPAGGQHERHQLVVAARWSINSSVETLFLACVSSCGPTNQSDSSSLLDSNIVPPIRLHW